MTKSEIIKFAHAEARKLWLPYRSLTGADLKKAKEVVERYRLYVGRTVVTEGATLGNILGKATRNPPVNFDKFEG